MPSQGNIPFNLPGTPTSLRPAKRSPGQEHSDGYLKKDQPYLLYCDGSDYAVSATFCQLDDMEGRTPHPSFTSPSSCRLHSTVLGNHQERGIQHCLCGGQSYKQNITKMAYHKGKLNVQADLLSRISQWEAICISGTEQWRLHPPLLSLPLNPWMSPCTSSM